MLILRDVYYSAIDENGEEKLFSVNEIMSEDEYLERLYASTEEKALKNKELIKSLKKAAPYVAAGGALVGGGLYAHGKLKKKKKEEKSFAETGKKKEK